jgi:hypothetical protein
LKIKDVIKQLGNTDGFLYLERYVNLDSRNYSPFAHLSEAAPKYQPSSDTERFEVPYLSIPKEKITLYLNDPDNRLLDHFIQKDCVTLPVHPEVFEDRNSACIEELEQYNFTYISAAPTASTRTVMPLNQNLPPHFIKLHYPRRISRFIRRLRKNSIQNSIEASKDLSDLSIPKFGYLPETIGMVYGSDVESWGCLIRKFVPRPVPKKQSLYIPLFALYSQDIKHPTDVPLLIQIIQHLNADPKEFMLAHIMHPMIQIWCTAVRERGILFEMHGYGRDASYRAPPAQIRTCSFPAYGSYLR